MVQAATSIGRNGLEGLALEGVATSALGQKQTFGRAPFYVRFTPESGHYSALHQMSAYDPKRTFKAILSSLIRPMLVAVYSHLKGRPRRKAEIKRTVIGRRACRL